MTVEIRAEAAQFPEKEYINGIAVAVQTADTLKWPLWYTHEKKPEIEILWHFMLSMSVHGQRKFLCSPQEEI